MTKGFALLAAAAAATSLLAGCSSDAGNIFNNSLTTSSITPGQPATATTVAAAPRVDPLCAALATRIDTLRKDGFTDRLEKAAVGKSANVNVKRATLGQAAELDRINAEFQSKCSLGPKPTFTQAAAAAPVATTVATPGTPAANTAAVVPVPATPAAKTQAPVAQAPAAKPVVSPPVVQQ